MESKKDIKYKVVTEGNREAIADFITQRVFDENEKVSYRDGTFIFSKKRT